MARVQQALRLAVVVALGIPSSAGWAADALRPATPVAFPTDVPCMTVVDRAIDPVLHITWDVPLEDLDVSPGEVPDGRRFQFFAFRIHFVGNPPNWITREDVDAAAAAMASASESTNVADEEILQDNPAWPADTWVRITADDARIPISEAAAADGVDWDTSQVPEGTYVIWGFTWDPARNAWSRRPGVVRVVDRAEDILAAPPSLGFARDPAVLMAGQLHEARLCLVAPPGSTLEGAFAVQEGVLEPQWRTFQCATALEGPSPVLEFSVPDGMGSGTLHLRAMVTAPDGATYTAMGDPLMIVGNGDGSPLPDSLDCEDDNGGGCRANPQTLSPGWPASIFVLLLAGAAPRLGRRRRLAH